MLNRPITLLTDFGADSTYVGQMKGAILKICPAVVIVDITHSIPPQDIACAARVLADTYPHFPEQTVHIAVVDPGVGTDRRIIAAECDRHIFIAPDNGLLTLVMEGRPPSQIVDLTNREFWADKVSQTFHGRDIMAPVAAHLANGIEFPPLGNRISVDSLQRTTVSQPKFFAESLTGDVIAGDVIAGDVIAGDVIAGEIIAGEIIAVDAFGNLISNIRRRHLQELNESVTLCVSVGDLPVHQMVNSYGCAESGAIVALFGSSDYLEIAQVNGHAAQAIGQGVGATVTVRRA